MCAYLVLKFDVNIHVAIGAGLAPGKRPKETHSSRSELAELSTRPDDGQRINHVLQLMPVQQHIKQVLGDFEAG